MAKDLRREKGMRERSPGVWELIVQAGKDPVTGKYRQISRTFRGGIREARAERAKLLLEASRGRHSGTNATMDDLLEEWLLELGRLDRSPSTIHGYRKYYLHDVAPTLGTVAVTKVTTKMLTDLYRAHQDRGLAPATVYQIHATISSMMTQACRWGWRDTNPAQYARTPPVDNRVRLVPSPAEVATLIRAAQRSRRPEYATVIFIAATTGIRRGEICALRIGRNVNWESRMLQIDRNVVQLNGQPLQERLTKNRRERSVAADDFTLNLLHAHTSRMADRAVSADTELAPDAYLFSDTVDGSEPWKPGAVTRYFARLRDRVELQHVEFRALRRFMGTYGQDLGFSLAQVALRAGHDPAVAAKHYTGTIPESDRALAEAVSGLLQAAQLKSI